MRNPTLAAAASVAIIVAAITFAAFAAWATGREWPVQQCTGFHCPADSVHQRGRAAIGVCGAGVILLANQRW
jgi:hypothetical protein